MSLSLHRIFDLSIRFSRYDAQEIECVRWKLASISTYSIDCIACLHAVSKSQICECGVHATRVPDAAEEASASEVQVV